MVTICPQSSSSPLPFMISSARAGKNSHSQTSQSVRYLSLSLPPWRPAEKQKPCQRQVYLPAPRNSLSIEMYVVTLGFGTHMGGASLSLFGSRNFCILGFLVNGAWRSNPFFYADNLSSVWFSYFLYPCIPFSPVPIGSHRGGAVFSLFWISSFLFLPSHPMVLCSSWVGAQTLARRTRSANSVCIFYFLVDSIQCMERGASFSVWCLSFLYPCSPPLFNVVLASIGAGCAGVWVPDPRRRFDLVIDIVVSLHPSVSTSQEDTENERQKQRTSLVFGSH